MAVTHATAMRNAIADLVKTRIDAGAGNGLLVFQTAGAVAVATLTFSKPSFGAASGGVITAAAITPDTGAVGGTITQARFRDSTGADQVVCSVTNTGGGGDIQLSSTVISAGQTVSLSSLTYTAPA
jgi:hypothetical protein